MPGPFGSFFLATVDLAAEASAPFFAGVSFVVVDWFPPSAFNFWDWIPSDGAGFAGVTVVPVYAFFAYESSYSYFALASVASFLSSSYLFFASSSSCFLRYSGSPLIAFLSMSNVRIVFFPLAFASSAAFYNRPSRSTLASSSNAESISLFSTALFSASMSMGSVGSISSSY